MEHAHTMAPPTPIRRESRPFSSTSVLLVEVSMNSSRILSLPNTSNTLYLVPLPLRAS
jgi:hypothetical protein